MGAFVFAAQMLNFTIPGTGSSEHLCGGLLLAAVVGPYAAFLTMIGVLLIQCLLFADGGLLALGANIWNMAFYGCFVGGGVIWALLMKSGVSRTKIILASVLGCVASLHSDSQLFMADIYNDVAFAAQNYGYTPEEVAELVQRALAQVKLEGLEKRQIYRLSGGQKKLVAIAGILTLTPQLLLMDEPSAALDAKNRRNLINILRGLPCTQLIASHDLDFIYETCDRVLLLHEGRLAAYGAVQDVLRDKKLLEACDLELPLMFQLGL